MLEEVVAIDRSRSVSGGTEISSLCIRSCSRDNPCQHNEPQFAVMPCILLGFLTSSGRLLLPDGPSGFATQPLSIWLACWLRKVPYTNIQDRGWQYCKASAASFGFKDLAKPRTKFHAGALHHTCTVEGEHCCLTLMHKLSLFNCRCTTRAIMCLS